MSRAAVLAAMVVVVVFAIAGGAFGDNLTSDAATTAGITTITAGGPSTTITYRLVANSAPTGDLSGCDADATHPVTVTINAPAAVTATASLSFTGCGPTNTKTATFSSSTAGSYNITHTISGGMSGSLFNNNADFTLTVNPATPTNTAPTLSLPADITAEATSASGAAVSYTATANDTEDGALTPSCSPASGSTFPLGVTEVDCSVTDSGGLTTTGMFNVTVRDTTAPTLTLPADKTVEATGPGGAAVTYSASASDLVDGSVALNCSPASGSTFALGTTEVDCSATDAHSNSATGSFNVTVQDTTAPALTLPADKTVEATGPGGAAVTYSASASDLVDGSVALNCSPASGSTFALGTTEVDCSATDAHSNSATGSFNVTVQDTTAPALTLPSNITLNASSSSQAVVTYTASATDLVDGAVTPSCTPASGSTFSIATTTVYCSATDAHNNTATGDFTVTVNYNWHGFFQPVDNPDTCNRVKAGSAIPVKFSLGGYQGMNVIETGYPQYGPGSCSGDSLDDIEQTVTAGNSSLNYDATTDQYIYVWKTDKAWAGQAKRLTIKFADGSIHYARFSFTR